NDEPRVEAGLDGCGKAAIATDALPSAFRRRPPRSRFGYDGQRSRARVARPRRVRTRWLLPKDRSRSFIGTRRDGRCKGRFEALFGRPVMRDDDQERAGAGQCHIKIADREEMADTQEVAKDHDIGFEALKAPRRAVKHAFTFAPGA